MNFKNTILLAGVSAGIVVSAAACVTVDTSVGQDYIPVEQQYDVYTFETPLSNVRMHYMDHMSGYSTRRLTFGSLDSEDFGLTRKSCAVTLVPCLDTIDFGTDPVVREFYVTLSRDTLNVIDNSQMNILQNVYVYSLRDTDILIDELSFMEDLKNSDFDGLEKITMGTPVYDGGDSLNFRFSEEFANKTLETFLEIAGDSVFVFDTITNYVDKFPGLYFCTDDPIGNSGRINMFNLPIGIEDTYYVSENFAELKLTSTYDGEVRDTSFLFLFGGVDTADGTDAPDQYCFNCTEIVGGKTAMDAGEWIYVEGGNGVKPVITGEELYNILIDTLTARINSDYPEIGLDEVLVNKAHIEMPFVFPDNYLYMTAYPQVLCPCSRVKSTDDDGTVSYTYANITDASISDEEHGDVDRSNLRYDSDISFFMQIFLDDEFLEEMEGLTDDEKAEKLENYSLWFLINYNEEEDDDDSSSSSDYSDYLYQMYYYNYLNSLYSGYSYSSYSSYGYNNYYTMLMYASLYSSSSSSSSSTTEELDRDRFYGATLYGPDSGNGPTLSITYSIPKKALQ